MKFLVDNNLSPALVAFLSELKFDAVHVRDYGMQRAPDEAILARAHTEDRIIVSADTDFGFLLFRWHKAKPSVVIFRNFSSLPARQFQAIELIANTFGKELEAGSLLIVEPGKLRIRKLPLF